MAWWCNWDWNGFVGQRLSGQEENGSEETGKESCVGGGKGEWTCGDCEKCFQGSVVGEVIMTDLESYCRERDEILLSGDVDKIIAFDMKYNPVYNPNKRIAEIVMHKARTGCKTLPIEARRLSKQWLEEHGWRSLDDGDL